MSCREMFGDQGCLRSSDSSGVFAAEQGLSVICTVYVHLDTVPYFHFTERGKAKFSVHIM